MTYFLQQTINGLILGAVYGLFALGFGLVLANLRIFNMAHEGVFAWSTLTAYFAMTSLDLPTVAAYALALAAGAILSVASYLVLIRHLHKRRNADMYGFVSSIGGLLILTQAGDLALGGGGATVSLPFGSFPIRVWHVGGLQVSSIEVLMAVVAVVAFVGMTTMMEATTLGREIKTVAFDRDLAGLLGIRVERVTMVVFAIAGLLAGAAALLFSIAFNVINPQMARPYSVLAIAITVVGGYGNIVGTFVAAITLGLVSTLVGVYWTSSYQLVLVYAMFLLALVVRPRGLFRTV